MALTKKLNKEENEYSIDFNDTYFKIDSIIIEVLAEEIIVSIRGYANVWVFLKKYIQLIFLI
jgi:hypothetical protein